MVVNGFGAVCTGGCDGCFCRDEIPGWGLIVIVLLPPGDDILAIHRHYRNLAAHLSLA
jgi:hypothetical protein